jgi:hypothetical protein
VDGHYGSHTRHAVEGRPVVDLDLYAGPASAGPKAVCRLDIEKERAASELKEGQAIRVEGTVAAERVGDSVLLDLCALFEAE